MSLRERLAWIATGCTLVVWGYYFTAFALDVAARHLDGGALLTRFLVCLGLTFALMIGLAIASGVMSLKNMEADPDELERMIEGRADRIGFHFIEWLVPAALIPCLMLTPRIAEAFPADPAGATGLIFAHAVLLVVIVTELVRETVQIVSFRMTS